MEEPTEELEEIGVLKRICLFVLCYWRSIVVVSTPILLLPITDIVEGRFDLCLYVICLMAIWWVTEALPLAITSLIPVILFPVMGILSMHQCCSLFVSDMSISFLGTFIVGQAFEYCLLDQRIALMILKCIGCRPILLHILLITTSFLVSMWIIDMAVVAIMCPIVRAILRELETHGLCRQFAENSSFDGAPRPSRTALAFYLGVSFASIFGGCSTLIGTGANAVMAQMYEEVFGRSISFVAFFLYAFPVMLLLVILSTVYLQWRFLGLFSKESDTDCYETEEALERTKQSVLDDYALLEPFVFHEQLVLVLFFVMVVLLLSRRPGFYSGWSFFFKGLAKLLIDFFS